MSRLPHPTMLLLLLLSWMHLQELTKGQKEEDDDLSLMTRRHPTTALRQPCPRWLASIDVH